MKKTILILALLGIVFIPKAKATCNYTITETTLATMPLSPGGTYTFHYNVTFGSGTSASDIIIHLQSGMQYANSFNAPGVTGFAYSTGTPSNPQFTFTTTTTSFQFDMNVTIVCPSAISQDYQVDNSNYDIGGCYIPSTTTGNTPLQVGAMSLSVTSTGLFINAGEEKDWVLTVHNDGHVDLPYIHFDLPTSINNVVDIISYTYNNIQPPSTIGCPTTSYITSAYDIPNPLLAGHTMYLHVLVKGKCYNSPTSSSAYYAPVFGISSTGCTIMLPLIPSAISVYAHGTPHLKVTTAPSGLVDNAYGVCQIPNGGVNGKTTLSFKYENRGIQLGVNGLSLGFAELKKLRVYLSSSTELGHIDPTSVKISDPTGAISIPLPWGLATNDVVNTNAIPYAGFLSSPMEGYLINFENWSPGVCQPLGPNSLQDLNGDGKVDDLLNGNCTLNGANTICTGNEQSFVLSFDFIYNANPCPYDVYNASAATKLRKQLAVTTYTYYQNQCDEFSETLSDPNYNEHALTSAMSIIFPPNYDAFMSGGRSSEAYYAYTSNNAPSVSSITIPADVDVAVNPLPNLTICPNYDEEWAPSNFQFNIVANSKHRIHVPLPADYHLNIGGMIHTNTTNVGSLILSAGASHYPVQATVTETIGTCSNHVYSMPGYIDIDIPQLAHPGGITDHLDCFELPLKFDCMCSPTPDPALSDPFGDDFSFEMQYIACDNTCVSVIASAETTTSHHFTGQCNNTVFETFNTPAYTFNRTTLGLPNANTTASPLLSYTATSYNSIMLSNATVHVSPTDPFSPKLDRVYPGDGVEAKITGEFTGDPGQFSEIYLQLKYAYLGADAYQKKIFELQTTEISTISIQEEDGFGNPVGLVIPYTLTGTVLDFEEVQDPTTSTERLRFKLPVSFILPNMFPPIAGTRKGYHLLADIHLRVLTNSTAPPASSNWHVPSDNTFFTVGIHNLQHFRAGFGGKTTIVDPLSLTGYKEEYSCDDWGAPLTILQPNVSLTLATHATSTCDEYGIDVMLYTGQPMWAFNEPDFPNEFRPYAGLSGNVQIIIPAGYHFVNAYYTITLDDYDAFNLPIPLHTSLTDNFFNGNIQTVSGPLQVPISPLITGTTLTFSPPGGLTDWPLFDNKRISGNIPSCHIGVHLQSDCDALDGTFQFWANANQNIQNSQDLAVNLLTSPSVHTSPDYDVHHLQPTANYTPPTGGATNITTSPFCSNEFTMCPDLVGLNFPQLLIVPNLGAFSTNAYLEIHFCTGTNADTIYTLPQTALGSGTFNLESIGSYQCLCIRICGDVNATPCSFPMPVDYLVQVHPYFVYSCLANVLPVCPQNMVDASGIIINPTVDLNFSGISGAIGGNPSLSVAINTVNAVSSICTGDQITLYASGANTYSWDDGVNHTIVPFPDNALTVSPSVTTTYTVTGSYAGGCPDQTATFTVIVNTPPPPPTAYPVTFCQNDVVINPLTAVGFVGSTLTWYTEFEYLSNTTGGSNYAGTTTAPTPTTFLSGVTTYYVTQTLTGGCESGGTQVVVTVNPAPTVNTFSPVHICNGMLTPSFDIISSTTTFTWANNNTLIGLAVSGNSDINAFVGTNTTSFITQTATITITPTADPITGCTGTPSNIIINVDQSPTVDPVSNLVLCNGSNATINFTGNANYFGWTNDNVLTGIGGTGTGDIIFTGSNHTSAPIVSNIIVTPVNACYGTPSSFTVTVNPCCVADAANISLGSYVSIPNCAVNPILLSSQIYTTGLNPCLPPTFATSAGALITIAYQTFSINGTFHVDHDLKIDGCDISMGAGASIEIDPGKVLTINNSHLHACTEMWNRIHINGTNSNLPPFTQINITGSVIEDGTNAVVSDFAGHYAISRSVFNKNYIGLVINRTDKNMFASYVGGSVFVCRDFSSFFTGIYLGLGFANSTLILNNYHFADYPTFPGSLSPQTTLLPPYTNVRSWKGIQANYVTNPASIVFGVPLGANGWAEIPTTNVFDYLDYGIWMYYSNVNVFNNVFTNIYNLPSYYMGNPLGVPTAGIWGEGHPKSDQHWTYTPMNLIVGGTSPKLKNYFYNCQNGMYSNAYNNTVLSNQFTNVANSFENPQHNQTKDFGILITDGQDRTNDIRANHMDGMDWGICALNMNYPTTTNIQYNYIEVEAPFQDVYATSFSFKPPFGVGVFHTFPNITSPVNVIQNVISLYNLSTVFTADGIRVVNTGKFTLKHNHMWYQDPTISNTSANPSHGIWLQGTPGGQVFENWVTSAAPPPTSYNDIAFGIFTQIANADIHNNEMHKMSSGISALGSCIGSQFYCNLLDNCYDGFMFWPPSTDINNQHYSLTTGNTWNGINNFYIDGAVMNPSTIWYDNDPNFATHVPPTTQLNYWLPTDPTNPCGGGGGVFNVGDWAKRENALGAIVRGENLYDSTQTENLLHDSIYAYRTLTNDTTWLNLGSADDTTYQHFYYFCQNENIGNFENVDEALSGSDSTADLNMVYLQNENLIPATATDSNRQDYNRVYIDKLLYEKDTLNGIGARYVYDSAELNKLNFIAQQNPVLGGEAVYHARTLLWIDVNDDKSVASAKKMKQHGVHTEKVYTFKLFPNPNNGNMTLEYKLEEKETGVFGIYSIQGKAIKKYTLNTNSTSVTIDQSQLAAGAYFWGVKVNDKLVKMDKLIIIK